MVRAGEVSPTELVRLCLERIERLDPQLNSFRKVFAEQALLEAEQAEARLKGGEERPLLGVPIAIKDEVDVAGEVDDLRHRRLHRAGQGRLRDGAAPARGGRDRRRHDPAAGAGDLRLHRVGDLGRHPQPLEPAAHAGRLQRRLRRGGRRRAGADRLGRRRRRLDPHPRRLLRPLRAEAVSAAGSRWRRSSRTGTGSRSTAASAARVLDTALWLDCHAGGSRGARGARPARAALRRVGADRRPGSCGSPGRPRPPRAAAPPTVDEVAKGAVAETAELLRSLGHEVAQRDPDWGMIGNNIAPRFLRGVAEDFARVPHPGAARTAHPRLRPARPPDPDRPLRAGAARAEPPTPPASTRSSTPTTC